MQTTLQNQFDCDNHLGITMLCPTLRLSKLSINIICEQRARNFKCCWKSKKRGKEVRIGCVKIIWEAIGDCYCSLPIHAGFVLYHNLCYAYSIEKHRVNSDVPIFLLMQSSMRFLLGYLCWFNMDISIMGNPGHSLITH